MAEKITALFPHQAPLDERETLQRAVRASVTERGMTIREAAAAMEISPTILGQWLGGRYTGTTGVVAMKAAAWLESVSTPKPGDALPEPVPWVATPTARAIWDILDAARMSGRVGIVHGVAGMGRTMSLAEYQRTRAGVVVVDATPGRGSLTAALRACATACGLVTKGRADDLEARILRHLNVLMQHEKSGLLAVDESQFMRGEALESYRRLSDLSGIGLAFLGNNETYHNISGVKTEAPYLQMHSRMIRRFNTPGAYKEDVKAILRAWGVTGKEEVALGLDIARTHGRLRYLTEVARLSKRQVTDGPFTLHEMEFAWKTMNDTGEGENARL